MFDKLLKRYMVWQTKRYAKGAARVMLLTCLAFKEKIVDANYYSDYAKLAITTRHGWSKISDNYFEHKSGNGIIITNEDSIKQVTKKLVKIEVTAATLGNTKSEELIKIAIDEIDKYFHTNTKNI